MEIYDLRTEGLTDPCGIHKKRPRLHWRLRSDKRGDSAVFYRVAASSTAGKLAAGEYDIWDSGVIAGNACSVLFGGSGLSSMQRVYWNVAVTDSNGGAAASSPAFFEMGLLEESDWRAKWIGAGVERVLPRLLNIDADVSNAAPILSREFYPSSAKKAASARLYISGLGLFEAHMNGCTLGGGTYFNPGESDARKTVYYCVYDITDILRDGKNAVSVMLGNGQYANYRIRRQRGRYYKTDDARDAADVVGMFGEPKCIAQIVITYADGSRDVIGTDEGWSYIEGPVTENSWYGGEDYDAKLEIEGWDDIDPAIPRELWGAPSAAEPPSGRLLGRDFEPIAVVDEDTIGPESISVSKLRESDGVAHYLVDMGRNGAGFPEITLYRPARGLTVRMYPAEVCDFNGFDGHIDQSSCTQSASVAGELIYDKYTAAGREIETYHPRFCYHGYRYVEVELPSDVILTSANFRGLILRTRNRKEGFFTSSDRILNAIDTLTERSIESNMYGTFTDCPQIEKLGWLETPSLMFGSMAHTYDISSWMRKLIRDMANAQYENGRIAAIAPEYFQIGGLHDDLNWNGSIIFTAWQYYETYGTPEIFSDENYSAMKKYMDYLENNVADGNLIRTGQMGEWGEMTAFGKTPVVLVETTAYYRLARTMADIAGVIGNGRDAAHYAALSEAVRDAFYKDGECHSERYLFGSGTQSGYGCALYSGICRDCDKDEAAARLIDAIEKNGFRLASGEVGLRQVFSSLADIGRDDIVYKMVTNDSMPSYKYFLDRGLTTLPEYWNFEEPWFGMARSRNHAMMGHVKEWFTKYILGIRRAAVGYDAVDVKPSTAGVLTSAAGKITTPHGAVHSSWRIDSGSFSLTVRIPVGVKAGIYLPAIGSVSEIDGARAPAEITPDGRYLRLTEKLGAGEYTISTSR